MKEIGHSDYHVLTYFENSHSALSQFTVSHNDGYTFYKTEWTAKSNFYDSTYFEKLGAPPTATNFDIPDFDVTFLRDEPNDFRINAKNRI
jgi:hypothetical protein